MALKLGYKLMTEEHGPIDLVRNARRAEEAGFDFVAASDHFSPWLEEQGHAPLVWPVLGAVANATDRIGIMTAVTCPIERYHPAVIAQGAATVAILSRDRFTLGLGSGERLNEHVTGMGWPGVSERLDRLSEAVDIIQGLLKAEFRTYDGNYFRLDNARLFDRPDLKPPVVIAASGPASATIAGEKGDGLIATEAKPEIVDAYRHAGGIGPHYAEVSVCCADQEEAARDTAHKYFRWTTTGWPVNAELPDTKAFAEASKNVSPEEVAQVVTCGPSAEHHLDGIRRYIKAGFDHIILTQIGPDQDYFFDFFKRELAPELRKESPELAPA